MLARCGLGSMRTGSPPAAGGGLQVTKQDAPHSTATTPWVPELLLSTCPPVQQMTLGPRNVEGDRQRVSVVSLRSSGVR